MVKYVLMFCADGEDVDRLAAMSDQERAAQYERVGAWFAENQSRIIGRQLAAPPTATTVRFGADGAPLLTDGHTPSPVVRLNRAVALRYLAGPKARCARSTRSPPAWTAITSTTPSAATCWSSSAAASWPRQPNCALSPSPASAEQSLLRRRLAAPP